MAEYIALDTFLFLLAVVVLAFFLKFAFSFVMWTYHRFQKKKSKRKGVRKHVRKKSS